MADAKAKKQPPREQDLAGKYTNNGQYTTLMIRNIPSEYTQDELVEEVSDMVGSSEVFDFFYLPWDGQANANVGYAFVNFLDPLMAKKAMGIFNNYRFRVHPSRKLGRTAYAHIQGLHNNLHHLRNRAVVQTNRECTPIIMYGGRKIEVSKVFSQLSQGGGGSRSGHTEVQQSPSSAPGRQHNGRVQVAPPPQRLPEDDDQGPAPNHFFDDDDDQDVDGVEFGGSDVLMHGLAHQRFVAPRSAPGLRLPYDPDEVAGLTPYGMAGCGMLPGPQQMCKAPLSDHGGAIIAEDAHTPMMLSHPMHLGGGYLAAQNLQSAMPNRAPAPAALQANWVPQPACGGRADAVVSGEVCGGAVQEILVPNQQERLLMKFMRKYG
mmetsp:Transcript_58934/g.140674  ORF Transcript_58934/g.140674 Transcript_58934/m.140674 type:complete len:376 (-) Transcript_58934:135-1262(-)|eukprot:CAMPEP_0178383258 /NCGR_PEP_ID=MMETSP0689_2-20121128/6910_1 /TAXON_ID=160604 /ORGANISM="Amphidinium massartii, Strain CS-259" /LENGTH=375 /DNA_ID=CAMNT_0020003475 /DNA_START=30 /DNA_END=1157 /DNA_ORIENTATION=-